MGYIHPAVSEICDPQSLDPICGKFDKFLAHGQAHIVQMGKWPWQCTTRCLDNSTKLRIEEICQAVTEIWVPQVWQPPARPSAGPPTRQPARTVTTIPLQPGGLRGKRMTDRHILDNYQPISLLITMSKVFEKVVFHQVYDYFSKNKLFYENRYGFRKKHSTELVSIELVDHVLGHLDQRNIPISVFLDLGGA